MKSIKNNVSRSEYTWISSRIAAFALIAFAAGLRILLIALGWPPTNSDEGTMGVMALNIAYHGAHPYIYYGQDYMGVMEAYLGAFFFHLSGGPSLFALRLGVTLMVTVFLSSTYLIASLLFSKKVAFVSVALLSVGSIAFLTRQTIATGGSSQTLMLGSIAFLLVIWLSLTYQRTTTRQTKFRRLAAYAGLGLVIGLGLWSDMIVLPFFAMAGLLLLVCCWRELLLWGWLVVLLFVFVGLQPMIRYDTAQGLNAWQILLNLAHGSNSVAPSTLPEILHNIRLTTLVSLPIATGSPFCPTIELTFLGDNVAPSTQCMLLQAGWGGGYLLLLGVALLVTLRALWRMRVQNDAESADERQESLIRCVAQLIMLGAALLTLTVYIMSSGPVSWPAFHARYLIGLLIITPALIEPLWQAASRTGRSLLSATERFKVYGCRIVLTLIACSLLAGTVIAFSEVPAAQAANQQRTELIEHLEQIGVRHIYTEYWTCNNVAFASNERIVCAVLDDKLQPTHNRAPHYYDIVHADPRAAYVFPANIANLPATSNGLPAVERMVAQAGPGAYKRYVFAGYVVYQPV